jgi:signal transduction histidine kinase
MSALEAPWKREWWPDALVGAVVAFLGIADLTSGFSWWGQSSGSDWFVTLGFAIAAGLFRRAPGGALLVVWLASILLVISSNQLLPIQIVVALVAYGTARYGNTTIVWLSGLSIPFGALAAIYVINANGTIVLGRFYSPVRSVYDGGVGPITFLTIGTMVLAVPWLVGLVVRSQAQTEVSRQDRDVAQELRLEAEAGRAQAQEIADLRAEQTRLAHDVHDVVGHSLAVILAQAESAQFLPDDDPERIRKTLENVATSARQSLQDVRSVLSGSDALSAGSSTTAGMDSLVDGLRTAGNDIRSAVFGDPRPLPPELDVVAFRVLQEMLTNALRHGSRGTAVYVERHWEGELRIEVRNTVDAGTSEAPSDIATDDTQPVTAPSTGLEGMRRRVEAIGGRLDVRRRDDPESGSSFTATAWIPLRTVTT